MKETTVLPNIRLKRSSASFTAKKNCEMKNYENKTASTRSSSSLTRGSSNLL